MQIDCPLCGLRSQVEFVYERTIDSVVGLGDAPEIAMETLYARRNPRGTDEEIWHHRHGCQAWLIVSRDRVTNSISSVRAAGTAVLP